MPRWEPDPNIRRGRTVVYNLHAHLVFTTKYRRPVFTHELLTACETTMRQVCTNHNTTLDEFNGETDHVHLLVHYPPNISLSTLVNSLKGTSSRHLKRDHPHLVTPHLWDGHLWSPSYFAASCGGAPLNIIKQYITQQQRPT